MQLPVLGPAQTGGADGGPIEIDLTAVGEKKYTDRIVASDELKMFMSKGLGGGQQLYIWKYKQAKSVKSKRENPPFFWTQLITSQPLHR